LDFVVTGDQAGTFGINITNDTSNPNIRVYDANSAYVETNIKTSEIKVKDSSDNFGKLDYTGLTINDSNNGINSIYNANGITSSTKISMDGPTGVLLNSSGTVQYSQQYNTTSQNLSISSKTIQTFDGNDLNAILPNIDSTNVGIQFIITTINNNLLIRTEGSQLIYSNNGPPQSEKTLSQGHSVIMTAIQSGISDYGWSMV
jgi:hypothetical protein